MPRSEQRLLAALTLITCAVLALACFTAVGAELMFFLPLLVIALPLIGGRYWGEETLGRLRTARSRPARERRVRSPLPRRRDQFFPRGARLMGSSLAVRPPPVLGALS